MLGFRQRPLEPLARRLRRRALAWLSNRPPRTQRAYLVTIEGQRFKRLVLRDSHAADVIARNLRAFAASGIYPALVFERENELWVEFVEGSRIERVDAEIVAEFARLFALLYTREPRRVPADQAPFRPQLHTDLRFLNQVGVLSDALHRELDKLADDLAPDALWVGYDCSDAILKNFLWCGDGRVRGIDVESLAREQLLGSGVAKASLRWLGPWREPFLSALRERGVPDFQAYLPFVELAFLAFWTKSSFLEKKRRFVDAGHFERFLRDL
jgi:hypothetical protein